MLMVGKKKGLSKVIIVVIVGLSLLGVVNKIDGEEIYKDMGQHSDKVQEAVEEVTKQGYMTAQGKGEFHPEGLITIEQSMKILARILDEEDTRYKEVAIKEGVLRPSDMVYNKSMWEETWRDILKGNKVFDKIDDETYSITIIPGYFRVQLNEQGYNVVKKGMIPQQVSFYTPFMDIDSYTPEVLEKYATKGFFIELLTIYDIKKGKEKYTGKEQQQRASLMQDITKKEIEEKEGAEATWGVEEYNKYNFLGISYNGQMKYAIERGILGEGTTIVDMNKPITRAEAAMLIKQVQEIERDDTRVEIKEVE